MPPRKSGANTVVHNTSASRVASTLRHLRTQIDKLDLQILKLINDRATVAAEIGKLKNEHGEEVFSPAREEEVIKNVLEIHTKNRGALDPSTVRAIFRELISGSRALQKVLKVAYLGPEYSFSHLAAVERFGQGVEFMCVGSIAAVFEEVNRGHVDFGVVPVENSTDGRVADTLDMFMRMPHYKSAPRCACRCTTISSRTARRRKSAVSTASRRRCRSAATGSARTCRRLCSKTSPALPTPPA
jgi:chorismate mutase/prephenate dehydratase